MANKNANAAATDTSNGAVLSTGVKGLDYVLCGGFTPHRLYLVEGVPGAGKTTLALQFLREGAQRDQQLTSVVDRQQLDHARRVSLTQRGARVPSFAVPFRCRRASRSSPSTVRRTSTRSRASSSRSAPTSGSWTSSSRRRRRSMP